MIYEKIGWVTVSLVNIIPFLAGAILQTQLTFKDYTKTYKISFGFIIATLLSAVVAIFDNKIEYANDVSSTMMTFYFLAYVIISLVYSKEIIIPMNSLIALVYLAAFWILYARNMPTIVIILALIATTASTILATKVINFRSALLEGVSYFSACIFLVGMSASVYVTDIRPHFLNGLNLTEPSLDWIQLFYSGSLATYSALVGLSALMILPIFGGKRTPIEEELARAKKHLAEIEKKFANDTFTFTTFSIFLIIISIIIISKYFFMLPNGLIIYLVILMATVLADSKPIIKN